MILIAGFAVKTGDVLIVAPILFVLGTLVALLKLHDDVGPKLYTCFFIFLFDLVQKFLVY